MGLKRFLRLNWRHSLYFPRGWNGHWWPQLDPTGSASHGANGKRTFTWHEPLWLFSLRQRLFAFAGRHRCGRRSAFTDREFPGRYQGDPTPDTWDMGPDGNRTCSCCGSVHPDDLMEICRKTLVDERYGIEGTDKAYKVYVRQPGVRNAGDGAIKFYMCHAPEKPTQEEQDLFSKAQRLTLERFMLQFARRA